MRENIINEISPSKYLSITSESDKSKTTVFVPKENLLFRKSYLDQIPFLKSIGFDFIRI